ncbi:hypothetical protein DPEC_G00024830 [Dallia pectoralis]|uniref:Uncharacterized protein n=1 Tax=Dallia pectoralis TaxID=75939 RepID=A0ACC2HH02_DALPE|nr:hypothetical protein DPEC_G00024830 [Dallia pectoralis]
MPSQDEYADLLACVKISRQSSDSKARGKTEDGYRRKPVCKLVCYCLGAIGGRLVTILFWSSTEIVQEHTCLGMTFLPSPPLGSKNIDRLPEGPNQGKQDVVAWSQ